MSSLPKASADENASDDEGRHVFASNDDRVRRRTSRAGTRSVTTLSTAQLERKRANDREAQRAIRQRTKSHIDELERKNADTDEKLTTALQRNAFLESENASLRSRLGAASSAFRGDVEAEENLQAQRTGESLFAAKIGRRGPSLPLATSEQRPRNDLSNVSPRVKSSTNNLKSAFPGAFNAVPWQGGPRQTPGNQILRAGNPSSGINSHVNGAPSVTTPYSKVSEGPSHDARYGGGNENITVPDQWQEYSSLSRLPDTPRPQGPFTPSLTAESPHSQHSSGYSAEFNAWTPETNTAITDGTNHSPMMHADNLIPPSINFAFLVDANGQPNSFYPAIGNQEHYEMIHPMEDQTNKPHRRFSRTASNEPRVKLEPIDSPLVAQSTNTTVGMPLHPRRGPPIDVRFLNLMGQPSNYAWEIPIRSVPPTCRVDETLLSFMQDRRRLALEGVRDVELVGPKNPSISSLLNPTQNDSSHPVSNVLTKLLCNLPALVTIPEKIALLWTMYLLLRWQISPTAQIYDSFPSWLTPRPSQLVTPHPIWMDQVPWPKLRDRLIHNQDRYGTPEFRHLHTAGLSVNWPYRPLAALIFRQDGEVIMDPAFERHINRLESWSLGPRFAARYPELEELCNFRPHGGAGQV